MLLVWRTAAALVGCVWLEPGGDGPWHLGSLTIDPRLQNAGHGRALLAAAEDAVRASRPRDRDERRRHPLRTPRLVSTSRLSRHRRHRALPYDDPRFGTPLRDDLSFTILLKDLEQR